MSYKRNHYHATPSQTLSLIIRQESGVTLIELIFSMVIISIALTGVMTVINLTIKHSADPVVQYQEVSIAESYLEEILLQSYSDPSGGYTGLDRSQFDDVDDYNGLSDIGVHDSQGNAISELSNYDVSILVSSAVTLAGSVVAKKVTVSVTGVSASLDLVGYRVDF